MTTVGFVMMCHTAPDRAAQVARHWVGQGAPVVIHVDKRADGVDAALRAALADLPEVSFSPRFKSTWGSWALVAAAQAASAQMLERHPEVDRVFLASGSCLPLRPLDELRAYLAAHGDTDFIESVVTAEAAWAQGGLEDERFTLHFPFSWRTNRWMFDRYVDLQRRIGWRRRIPDGLVPHLGSQWWCLTRETLARILSDPRRAEFDAYFKGVWIPDESYFQTMARRHSRKIESRSLTLNKFDVSGLPHVFYDDHLELLRRSEVFVARKIWPQADRLYSTFLAPQRAVPVTSEGDEMPAGTVRLVAPNSVRIDRIFDQAVERRTKGRAGLFMQSRFPGKGHETTASPGPYIIFQGFTPLFPDFEGWLSRRHIGRVHGHLFNPRRVQFSHDVSVFDGGLSDSAELRDYNQLAFLSNLLWAGRGERQVFMTALYDRLTPELQWRIVTDPNASLHVITGAWIIPLFLSGKPIASLWREAARMQRLQSRQMQILTSSWRRAKLRIWSLSEFMQNPAGRMTALVRDLQTGDVLTPAEPPTPVDIDGLGRFIQTLRNQGLRPDYLGDFPEMEVFAEDVAAIAPQRASVPSLPRSSS